MSGNVSKKSTITSTIASKHEEWKWLDIMAIDEIGNSALMLAIQDNKLDTAKFIVEKACRRNQLNDMLQIVNKNDENAYSLALRAENSAFIRLIEEATEKIKKLSFKRSRKFLKYKSSESFKVVPKKIDMHRPKSEEAVGSASTSDIETEIDETLATVKKKKDDFTEMLTQKLSSLSNCDEENHESNDEKTPALTSLHSESFTFEHKTIDFVPIQSSGIMDSLSGKFRSLMGGRKDDLNRPNKRASITTTQVHFTTMPFDQCEVYDGTDHKRFDIDNAISDDQSKDRLTIAHHHYDDFGDNSVCVPPEFSGPGISTKLMGDKLSGHTSAAQSLIKPLRNLKSRGQTRDGRAENYKAIPDSSQNSTNSVTH